MPRDRFKTRASYDADFKFGVTEFNFKSDITVTEKQVSIMKKMYRSNLITDWERDFLKSVSSQRHLSDKQKMTLNRIYQKTSTYDT